MPRTTRRHALCLLLGAVALLSLTSMPAAAQSASETLSTTDAGDAEAGATVVRFWEGTWNTVKINTEIASFILENGYDGIDVQQVDVSTSLMQQAMLEGEIDVNLELWCINREQFCTENFGDSGPLTKLSPIYKDSTQGWYVPRYVVEESEGGDEPPAPELASVRQLGRYVDLFSDPANPGQGRILTGVSGWAITASNQVKLHAYGLAQDYNAQTVGSQAALDSAIVGAIQQREPIVAYYWTPTWIMGKYDMVKLDEPEWSEACEQARDQAAESGPPFTGVTEQAACAFQTTDIIPGIVSDLRDRAPQVVELIDAMDVGLEPISAAAAYMKDEGATAEEAALWYLRNNPERWRQWVSADVADRVEEALSEGSGGEAGASLLLNFPATATIPLESWVERAVDWIVTTFGGFFGALSDVLTFTIARVTDALLWTPWLVIVALFGALGWFLQDWKLGVGVAGGLVLLGLLGIWDLAIQTLALILFATALSVATGIPLGIWAARNDRVDAAVRPVLDFMQTMPSFVYLVPAVILFSIGQVPALIATVIYATPPVVRLTNLGIRQVPADAVEAAEAFGSTPRQTLREVQLPLAFPTIMAGVNQTVMLALAMVVIASLVGADGLGRPVLDGLQNLNIGLAFVGGLGIVILAMIIDRLTQAAGRDGEEAPT